MGADLRVIDARDAGPVNPYSESREHSQDPLVDNGLSGDDANYELLIGILVPYSGSLTGAEHFRTFHDMYYCLG